MSSTSTTTPPEATARLGTRALWALSFGGDALWLAAAGWSYGGPAETVLDRVGVLLLWLSAALLAALPGYVAWRRSSAVDRDVPARALFALSSGGKAFFLGTIAGATFVTLGDATLDLPEWMPALKLAIFVFTLLAPAMLAGYVVARLAPRAPLVHAAVFCVLVPLEALLTTGDDELVLYAAMSFPGILGGAWLGARLAAAQGSTRRASTRQPAPAPGSRTNVP